MVIVTYIYPEPTFVALVGGHAEDEEGSERNKIGFTHALRANHVKDKAVVATFYSCPLELPCRGRLVKLQCV